MATFPGRSTRLRTAGRIAGRAGISAAHRDMSVRPFVSADPLRAQLTSAEPGPPASASAQPSPYDRFPARWHAIGEAPE